MSLGVDGDNENAFQIAGAAANPESAEPIGDRF
jgi:hypothetical protein